VKALALALVLKRLPGERGESNARALFFQELQQAEEDRFKVRYVSGAIR